jgi:hypothetical protein
MKKDASRLLSATLVAVSLGCGPASGPGALEPTQEWSEDLAATFDDGFDFVTPLRTIMGTPWFDEYAVQLERRLAEADVVAVVAVRSVLPAGQGQAFGTLEVDVEEPLLGPVSRGTVLRLDVANGSNSAEQLEAERARIDELGRFVAYVRLYVGETGETRAHWHLSPRDDDLLGTIRRVLHPPAE